MKQQIKRLSYLFFVFIFISSYLELILVLQYGNPNISLIEPFTTPFFWPRLIISVIPSIVLIVFSSVRKQWADLGLILWVGAALGHAINTINSVFHPLKYLPNQHDNVIQTLYVITNSAQFVVLLSIIGFGVMFIINNNIVFKLPEDN